MNTQEERIILEWSRWITINGADPRDIDPTEYTGPVVFQRNESATIETGECGDDGITKDGVRVSDASKWKPAPITVPKLEPKP